MQKILHCFISISLLVTFCGCSNNRRSSRENINVGIVMYDETDAFLTSLSNRINSEAAQYSLNITTAGSRRSQLTENQLVKDMIADGSDILFVNLVDRTDTSAVIKAAEDADVPIVFFNREPVESDLERWKKLYYVGADAEESGLLQGEIAISYLKEHPESDLNNDGWIQYYMLEGETGHQDAIIRTEKSVSALNTASITLAKEGYSICNWNRDEAYKVVCELIGQRKNIELMLANNDEMAAGAVQAYDDNNIDASERPVIIGIDGTKTGLNLVNEGKMAGTVFNDYIGQADAMIKITMYLFHGESLENVNMDQKRRVYLPYRIITSDNVETYLQQMS